MFKIYLQRIDCVGELKFLLRKFTLGWQPTQTVFDYRLNSRNCQSNAIFRHKLVKKIFIYHTIHWSLPAHLRRYKCTRIRIEQIERPLYYYKSTAFETEAIIRTGITTRCRAWRQASYHRKSRIDKTTRPTTKIKPLRIDRKNPFSAQASSRKQKAQPCGSG